MILKSSINVVILIAIVGLCIDISIASNIRLGLDFYRSDSLELFETNFINFDKSHFSSNWEWVTPAGEYNFDQSEGICVDSDGNAIVTGFFVGKITFGEIILNGQGETDIFVAKIDDSGKWLWAKRAGGNDFDKSYSISVDDWGNTYFTGDFKNTSTFGSTTLTSQGVYTTFVAKLDRYGNWQWATQSEGNYFNYGIDICTDSQGNSYITGVFSDSIILGDITLTSQRLNDIFIAKLDVNGNWQWAAQASGNYSSYACDLCIDNSGSVYTTGYFYKDVIFGSTKLISEGDEDVFVAKLDVNGNWQWASKAGGNNREWGSGIKVDNNHNLFVTGYFQGPTMFDEIMLASQGELDVFIAKMNASGKWVWAQCGGTNFEKSYGIDIDNQGNSYITGYFLGNTTIGSSTLESQGSREIFVAKLDGQGNWQWAVQGGGIGCDEAYDIAVDNQGNAYITGIFWQNASFGTIMLTSKGSFDIFIGLISSKNKPPDNPVILGPNNGSVGMKYTYNISTIDPDNDDVFYHVKWGDSILPQIYGPYPSEKEVILNHTWYKHGSYAIKAKAKDSNGAESDWVTLEVSIPKNKAINSFILFLERLIERFPILQQILQSIYDKLAVF